MFTTLSKERGLSVELKTCPYPIILQEITGAEKISEAFEYRLSVLISDKFNPKEFMAKPITIRIQDKRSLHGVLLGARSEALWEDGFRRFILSVKPCTEILNCGLDCKHYKNLTVMDITQQILKANPMIQVDYSKVDSRIYPKLNFTVQYNAI